MDSIFKKNKKWYIDYYDPYGKRVRWAVSRYKETAELALKKAEIDIAEGKYLDVKRTDPITFRDFAEKFRKKHIRRRNKSIKNQEYLLDQLIRHFDRKMMHELTRTDIDDYLEQRFDQWRASTINKDLTMLKSLFNRANEWGDLNGHNPAQKIKKLDENNERCRYLTEEEQQRLLANCHGVLHMVVLTAFKTGLRWGELIRLKWTQSPQSNYVDFENNVIFIHEALTKSKKSRYVPLAHSVKQALLDFPQRSASDYIFESPLTGKPYDNLDKSFRSALQRARIDDFHFHDLRHCFASDLVRNGVDLFVVQKLLGHSSPRMTQRYAHLAQDQLKRAIDVLDDQHQGFSRFSPHLDTTSSSSKIVC